jgi:hypothetical protein
VKTLLPAVGLAFLAEMAKESNPPSGVTSYLGAVVISTAPDKEQVLLQDVTSGALPASTWVNNQIALGRVVIVSTNDPAGLSALMADMNGVTSVSGQVVLAAVTAPADVITAAGPSMPNAALLTAPVNVPGTLLQRAEADLGLSSTGVAVAAVVVVGGGILLVNHFYKKRARANRRRRG